MVLTCTTAWLSLLIDSISNRAVFLLPGIPSMVRNPRPAFLSRWGSPDGAAAVHNTGFSTANPECNATQSSVRCQIRHSGMFLAGIQALRHTLDHGFRRGDGLFIGHFILWTRTSVPRTWAKSADTLHHTFRGGLTCIGCLEKYSPEARVRGCAGGSCPGFAE